MTPRIEPTIGTVFLSRLSRLTVFLVSSTALLSDSSEVPMLRSMIVTASLPFGPVRYCFCWLVPLMIAPVTGSTHTVTTLE